MGRYQNGVAASIEDEHNQDMEHEYIGELILQKASKSGYTNVEVYTDSMRHTFESIFRKNGYDIKVKYNNTHAFVEITATKAVTKYIELAILIAVLWAVYRVYTRTINLACLF